jgi:hypothetical protein
MKRRRRWQAPNNPTPQAKAVWTALFPREPWPKGWRVQWVGFMRGAQGLTIYRERRVLLSWGDRNRHGSGPVETLLHEFVHMRAGHELRHGPEFRAMTNRLHARLGLDPEPEPTPQPPRHRHRYITERQHPANPGVWMYTCDCGYTVHWFRRRPELIKLAEYAAG